MSAFARLDLDPSLTGIGAAASAPQTQTGAAFGFKWAKRDTYESGAVQEASRRWLFERYCGGDPGLLDAWLQEDGGRKLILDAGCGAGHSALLFFGQRLLAHDYLGADISDSVGVARERFREHGWPGDFLQWDLLDLPVPDGSFDLIFSEGVLHHTDSTEGAFQALARKLAPGGRFLFYVYARKATIREFTDDHVRAALSGLSDAEAWEALKPLTRLGVALGELGARIEVPEDIPFLGIKAGELDLQRFFYWNILKSFYRPDYNLEEMNHINFDWFRPLNCHRQSPAEVESWIRQAGLTLERLDVQEAGITAVAKRPRNG